MHLQKIENSHISSKKKLFLILFAPCKVTFKFIKGWRSNMEDTIIAISPFDIQNNETISLFGVFDGHGGNYIQIFRR